MATPDYVIVGSGINALVAAAMLGRKGKHVLILERNDRIGGCIRTEEATIPGFVHDILATTFVLFAASPAYAELGDELQKRGLAFANTAVPTAVVLPDGRHLVLRTDRRANVSAFDSLAQGDGVRYGADMDQLGVNARLLFALLGGTLWSRHTLTLLAREAWRQTPRGLAALLGAALGNARHWLETYQSDLLSALLAPWVLHTGLGPESAYSGQMAKIITYTLEAFGAPIVIGGADKALHAFERLICDQGGKTQTGCDVDRLVVENGSAKGVLLTGGQQIQAGSGVICSVTPNQLYTRLLRNVAIPPEYQAATEHYRYGKGNMQIHYALKEIPRWRSAELNGVALIHLTPGLDGVSKAANEAERGMLPSLPTVCVGQPAALDSSRCPPGRSILWLQLPEAPRRLKGDAAGEIPIPANGQWSAEIRERFADRVEAVLAAHIENFSDIVLARRAYSPADLEMLNVNLVGGDPYGGYCGLDQFFLWRPFPQSLNHRTPILKLYHIGASTHPGPGLGGGSGYLLAKALNE
jgi:phytoene dehydrogenase-like protein